MMACIIIEDQPPAQRILKKFIEDVGTLELKACFPDALQAMDFLKKEEIGLIFLDIHLPKISGMDFLKILPNPPHVILTTAFSDYALESYEFNVVDYLLKPFSFQRFVKAVSKVPLPQSLEQYTPPPETASPREIFVKSGYDFIKVALDELLFLKSDADYTELFLAERKHLSSEPLRYWAETLDAAQFVRIHKSYIVNLSKIKRISGNRLFLSDGRELPIGRVYKDALAKYYAQ